MQLPYCHKSRVPVLKIVYQAFFLTYEKNMLNSDLTHLCFLCTVLMLLGVAFGECSESVQ